MRYYLGAGSRATPTTILEDMGKLASELENLGWTLRSGAAGGADTAFAEGVKEKAQIWLPWDNFISKPNPNHTSYVMHKGDEEAFESITKYHPKPDSLSKCGRYLMARNYRQIVGIDEPNSEFVVCWTKNGGINGGTGQAMRIAIDKNIKIYNMFSEHWQDILTKIKFEYE